MMRKLRKNYEGRGTGSAKIKFQTPNFKFQTNSKSQSGMTNTPCSEFWALEFIWNLGLGIWCLFKLLSFPTHR